jgi:hypothetical protein
LRSRLLIIVLAAVLALAGTAAVFAYARQADERAIAGLTTENVLTAKGLINQRTSLAQAQREGLLTTLKLPERSVSSEAIRSTTGLGNLVFDQTVQPGAQVLRPMLVNATQSTASNVLNIPANHVAVTLQLCVQEAVGGYLTAGSYAEVYGTVPLGPKVNLARTCATEHNALPPGTTNTHVMLQKALVLAVVHGQSGAQSTSTGSSVVAYPINTAASAINAAASALSTGAVLVTFAVTSDEAATLIQDSEVYLPYLALYPPTN